jgi:predicted DNA-binding transcriptional regulator AlpA
VAACRKAHPAATAAEVAKITGLGRSTVYEHWDD